MAGRMEPKLSCHNCASKLFNPRGQRRSLGLDRTSPHNDHPLRPSFLTQQTVREYSTRSCLDQEKKRSMTPKSGAPMIRKGPACLAPRDLPSAPEPVQSRFQARWSYSCTRLSVLLYRSWREHDLIGRYGIMRVSHHAAWPSHAQNYHSRCFYLQFDIVRFGPTVEDIRTLLIPSHWSRQRIQLGNI